MLSMSDLSVLRRDNSDMLDTTGANESSSSLYFWVVRRRWSLLQEHTCHVTPFKLNRTSTQLFCTCTCTYHPLKHRMRLSVLESNHEKDAKVRAHRLRVSLQNKYTCTSITVKLNVCNNKVRGFGGKRNITRTSARSSESNGLPRKNIFSNVRSTKLIVHLSLSSTSVANVFGMNELTSAHSTRVSTSSSMFWKRTINNQATLKTTWSFFVRKTPLTVTFNFWPSFTL